MRRLLAVLGCAMLAACLPTIPPPPAPMQVIVRGATKDVIFSASRTLTLAGFDIATSDQSGGLVSAKRTGTPESFSTKVQCRAQGGSPLMTDGVAAFSVNVVARQRADSTEIVLSSRVFTSHTMLGVSTNSETSCVSSGELEASIVAALKGA